MTGNRKLSDREGFRLEIATAVARERLFEIHAAHAAELVRLLEGRVPPLEVLGRYARRQRLSRQESTLLRNRVLAGLTVEHGEADPETGPTDGPRGGVAPDVEELLELAGGRASAAVLDCHVRSAAVFMDLLAAVVPLRQAARVYADSVGLPRSWEEVVYCKSLERRGAGRLPAFGGGVRKAEHALAGIIGPARDLLAGPDADQAEDGAAVPSRGKPGPG